MQLEPSEQARSGVAAGEARVVLAEAAAAVAVLGAEAVGVDARGELGGLLLAERRHVLEVAVAAAIVAVLVALRADARGAVHAAGEESPQAIAVPTTKISPGAPATEAWRAEA